MNVIATASRRIVSRLHTVSSSDRGAAMVEYAMLIGLIAMVAMVAVTTFGEALADKNTGIANSIADATGSVTTTTL